MININRLSFSKIIFIFFCTIYLSLSWYFSEYLHVYFNDTVSRTANAFFTIFGRDPHMAAIGFVWPPLPSLLQTPFLLIFHFFNMPLLTGPIVSSLLGAFTVVVFYKISLLLNNGKHSFLSVLTTIFYGLNPMIMLYSAIGSSETIFILFLTLSTYFLLKWYLQSNIYWLILSSVSLIGALGSRYESIPFFLTVCILIILIELSVRSKFKKIQALLLLFCLPFIFSFALWIFANWLIEGNPFYFLNSSYSNSSYTATLHHASTLLKNSYHSVENSVLYAGERILLLAPGLPLLPLAVFGLTLYKKEFINRILLLIILLTPYFSILAFHIYLLYSGQSFGWLRFFIYSIVALTLMSFYFIKIHKIFKYIVFVSLFGGFLSTIYAMNQSNYGKEEIS